MKKLSIVALLFLSISVLFACKKDSPEAQPGTHTVVYKAQASSGVNIGVAIVSTDGKGGIETFSSLSGDSWTSKEYTVVTQMPITFAANGIGTGPNSTLNVEIWVDGVKKSEGKSTGDVLSATTSFNWK